MLAGLLISVLDSTSTWFSTLEYIKISMYQIYLISSPHDRSLPRRINTSFSAAMLLYEKVYSFKNIRGIVISGSHSTSTMFSTLEHINISV